MREPLDCGTAGHCYLAKRKGAVRQEGTEPSEITVVDKERIGGDQVFDGPLA
jgi:hypothetical protein